MVSILSHLARQYYKYWTVLIILHIWSVFDMRLASVYINYFWLQFKLFFVDTFTKRSVFKYNLVNIKNVIGQN